VQRSRAASTAAIPLQYQDDRPLRVEFFREVRERGLDIRFGLAAFATQVLCMALLSAAGVVCLRTILLRSRFGERASLWLSLLYGFGTPVFFRTGFLNHNLLIAHFALFAFALLYRPGGAQTRPLPLSAAGAAAGFGLLCDYSAVVTLVALGSYAFWKLWRATSSSETLRGMAWMVAGASLPIAVLLAYQAWAFGNPFLPAQYYMPSTDLSVHGWNGLGWPALDLVARNLFDPAYGIFAFAPILLLGLLAPLLVRAGTCRLPAAEVGFCLALFAALLLFVSANQFARLQWNTGFRMLAPAVPFLFLAAAAVLDRMPERVAFGLGALAVAQSWCIAMVREDAFGSVVTVLSHGITFPWLTSVWRAGGSYLPFLQKTGAQGLPLILLAALLLVFIWGLPGRRAEA
jgi:hypothetical protein